MSMFVDVKVDGQSFPMAHKAEQEIEIEVRRQVADPPLYVKIRVLDGADAPDRPRVDVEFGDVAHSVDAGTGGATGAVSAFQVLKGRSRKGEQ